MPDFDWNNPSLNTIEPYSSFQLFIDKSQPIFQVIDFPTRKTKILDILLTNAPDLICKLKEEPPIGNSDHIVITGVINVRTSPPKCAFRTVLNFRKADYSLIDKYFRANFAKFDFTLPIEISWKKFYEIINQLINMFVPLNKIYFYKQKAIPQHVFRLYKKFSVL